MANDFGELLVAATAVAISPVPIVGVILILFSTHARRNGVLYLLGWVLGLLVVIGCVLLLPTDLAFQRGALLLTGGAVLRIVMGLFFVVTALAIWLRRPKTSQTHPMPAWTERIDEFSGWQAFGLAIGLAVINPKNLAVAFALILSLVEAGAGPWAARLVLAVFVGLGSLTIAAPVIYRLVAGKAADEHLHAWKEWLIYHNAAVMGVIFLLMGMLFLGKGLGGLL